MKGGWRGGPEEEEGWESSWGKSTGDVGRVGARTSHGPRHDGPHSHVSLDSDLETE